MGRQIIGLDQSEDPTGTMLTIKIACWLTAPASRIRPMPNFVSAVPTSASGVSWGATTDEIAALQSGTIVEQVVNTQIPTSIATAGNIETLLQATFTALQGQLTTQTFSAIHLVGAQFDGTTWTAGP